MKDHTFKEIKNILKKALNKRLLPANCRVEKRGGETLIYVEAAGGEQVLVARFSREKRLTIHNIYLVEEICNKIEKHFQPSP